MALGASRTFHTAPVTDRGKDSLWRTSFSTEP